MTVRDLIARHEGWRSRLYRDSEGLWTIGYGFCLDPERGVEMPREVGDLWLEILIRQTRAEVAAAIPCFRALDEVRQAVLIDMAYNLGVLGLLRFRKMLTALERGDYHAVADEMLDSRWAWQVGRRATELAEMMRSGAWPA